MQNLPHLVKRAHFSVRQAIDNSLAVYDLTSAQLEVLSRVANCSCMEHRALLQDMEVASPTLTKLVDGLVERGLVKRAVSPDDARVKLLELTAAGKGVHQEMNSFYQPFLERLLSDFSPAERLLFGELLERLIANADQIE
ncbi:MAG: MarR family transcriptional regulator [Ardenticatenaceae bacterium]|nr:MarR family transcriptional regulator [Ardenticatenaceae bacterium]